MYINHKNLGHLDVPLILLAAVFAFDGSQAHGGDAGGWSCGPGGGLDDPCVSLPTRDDL